MDVNSAEFNDLLVAWTDALKVLDTKLNAYYSAIAALENNAKYPGAGAHFKEALTEAEKNPNLAPEMNEKYRLGLLQLRELSSGSRPAEAVRSWFSKFQQTQPDTPPTKASK
jgi:hypothetical protein